MKRDLATGRYDYDGQLQRRCVCGHALGDHAAERPRECFTSTFNRLSPDYDDCDCAKFRPSRLQPVGDAK